MMLKFLAILPLLLAITARADDAAVTVARAAVESVITVQSTTDGSSLSAPVKSNVLHLDLKLQSPAFKNAIAVKLGNAKFKWDGADLPLPDHVQPVIARDNTIPLLFTAALPEKIPSKLAGFSAAANVIVAEKTETLAFEKIADLEGKELDDKKLTAAGIKITVNKANTEGLALILEGNAFFLTAVRVKSGNKVLDAQTLKTEMAGKTFLAIMTEMPDNPVVELDVATQVREISVPINLKEIALEPPATRPAK